MKWRVAAVFVMFACIGVAGFLVPVTAEPPVSPAALDSADLVDDPFLGASDISSDPVEACKHCPSTIPCEDGDCGQFVPGCGCRLCNGVLSCWKKQSP